MYLFNAKIESPEKLEQMLVGRERIVKILVENQLQHNQGGMPPQFLVIGPRGSGKTHILRVVYDRLSGNREFMALHEIAFMVEDETGIGSYFDLLHRIFLAVIRWNTGDHKIDFIIEQVEYLKEISPKEWEKQAEKILLTFLKDKTLLILIENFDSIMRGMDYKNEVKELARLRDFIQQYNQVSFIATSQSLIHSLSDDKNPLYGFFNILQLKRLTLVESSDFIKKVAQSENNNELVEFLESCIGKGKLEAIHQFTRGNHRLLLVFFDFLKAEFRSNLSEVFLKSIDELKPYYDSLIKSLAPQQQKIVQYLSLQRNPQKGADIGRNCFLDKSVVSKQISELQRLGYILAVNEKGRDKYYEISEPLLRMCFEINEDRNGIIRLFVDFLGHFYTAEQLKEKYLQYNYMDRFQPEPLKKLYKSEANIYNLVKSQYLSSWSLREEEEKRLNTCGEADEAAKMILEISNQKGTELLNQINLLIKNQEWDKAIEAYQKAVEIIPEDYRLWYNLGNTYNEIKKYDRAIDAYLKALEIKPNDEETWNNLGNSYDDSKQHEKAIEAYLKAIELKPDYEGAWVNLGITYSEIEKYDKAIEAYLKTIEIKPDHEKVWYHLGNFYVDTNQNDKAIEAYLKAIEIKPDNEKACYNLGILYSKSYDYENAIKAFLKAIEIRPDKEEAWNYLGISYGESNQYEKANRAFLKAIEINPDDEDAWINLGTLYDNSSQYDKSIETFLKAIEINPSKEEAWYNLGTSYGKSNQHDKAIEAFLKAIEIKPDDEKAWYNLGNSYNQVDLNDKAINAYLKAIEIKPDKEEAWNNLGITYGESNQYEKANKAFLKVIEIKPDDEEAWINLGISYNISKQDKKAIKAFLKAIEINPKSGKAWYSLGYFYYLDNRLRKAKDTFLKALKSLIEGEKDDIIEISFVLLEVQFALKEIKEALSSIEALLGKPEQIALITKLEDAMVVLVKNNSEEAIKEVFNKLVKICGENGAMEQFSALLSNIVFRMIRERNDFKTFRLEMLEHLFRELFSIQPELTFPIKYFNIGIRYYLNGEIEALYEMSQEERAVFEKFTNKLEQAG